MQFWQAALMASGLLSCVLLAVQVALRPLYTRVALSLLEHTGKTDTKLCANVIKQQRELLCYAILVALGWGTLPWYTSLSDQSSMWASFSIPSTIGVFYVLQMAMYLHLIIIDLVDRCTPEGPDPMDIFSWIHHILCLVMATTTLLPGYVRPGAMTFLMHDPSSLALKTARVLHLADWKGASKTAFKVFAGLFFMLRLCIFPALCMNSALVHTPGRIPDFARWSLGAMLSFLIAMNCFFMYKIVAVVRREAANKSKES